METATAVGFGHIVSQMKQRIDETFYRGGTHKYRAPIVDLREVYNARNSQAMRHVKAQLVESAVKSWIDHNLKNNTEVETCMNAISEFDNAVRAYEASELSARAQASNNNKAKGAPKQKNNDRRRVKYGPL